MAGNLERINAVCIAAVNVIAVTPNPGGSPQQRLIFGGGRVKRAHVYAANHTWTTSEMTYLVVGDKTVCRFERQGDKLVEVRMDPDPKSGFEEDEDD